MSKGFEARAAITIDASPAHVWEALTNPAIIREYLFGTEVISTWKVGARLTYRGEWQGKSYEDKGRILELVPLRRFVSTFWSSLSGTPDLPENYNTVTWQLSESNGSTVLSLTQDNNPTEESASHSAGNWRGVLETMKEIVEARAPATGG